MPDPDFLIIGAQKAGTTSLYYFLGRHPEIHMSPNKEPEYFADERWLGPRDPENVRPNHEVTSDAEYAGLFADADADQVTGEASTIYLYSETAPERIHAWNPDVRLIVLLRDPAERAFSNYMHQVRNGRETESFEAAIEAEPERRRDGASANWHYRAKGFYGEQLERWYELFDPEQIHVQLYEDYDEDPEPALREIYSFLGVDPGFEQDLELRLNVSGAAKREWLQRLIDRAERFKWLLDPIVPAPVKRRLLDMQTKTLEREEIPTTMRRRLDADYADDTATVERLTGLDVSRWRRPAVA